MYVYIYMYIYIHITLCVYIYIYIYIIVIGTHICYISYIYNFPCMHTQSDIPHVSAEPEASEAEMQSSQSRIHYPEYDDNVCSKLFLSREQNNFRSRCP